MLVATSTLAWGVNLPCHLVIVKGTEYFDVKTSRYVNFEVTDILQMMGRAGRPQFDETGVACVFVHDVHKNFYRESSLALLMILLLCDVVLAVSCTIYAHLEYYACLLLFIIIHLVCPMPCR